MLANRIHVLLSILTLSVLPSLGASTYAIQTKQGSETPVDYVDDPTAPQTSLGTKKYEPGNDEKKFFDKLDADEITTGGLAGEYEIGTRDRKYVGWFGIVRKIEIDNASDTTRLLIEHKYFDGFTDLHLQAVSFNGSGDFVAILNGTGHSISELELIKTYGIVTAGDGNKLPSIDAKFAKCWSWGSFTFITAAGKQRGSEQWRKLNTVNLDDIYSSRPDESYYVKRLGPTKTIAKRRKIEALGRQAAVTMGTDPDLLLESAGVFTKLVNHDEFRKRAIESALKLHPESKSLIQPIVESLINADYDSLRDATETALNKDKHDAVAAVLSHAYVLDDDDDTAATNDLEELSYSAGKCLPALIEALRCDDDWSRSHAARILGDVGAEAEAAIPALIILLADSDGFSRSTAATVLGEIGKRPEIVVPALALALEDSDAYVRFSAAGSLESFGHDARSAAAMLANVVKEDEDNNARWQAASALGRTGNAEVALPILIEAIADKYAPIRRFAAMGLGNLEKSAGSAIPQLKKLLNDPDVGTRIAAAEALWKIEGNTEDTLPVLESELKGQFPAMWAAEALRHFGAAAKPVLPSLIAATRSSNRYVRSSSVEAIANIGPEAGAGLPRLKELLGDKDVETRVFAAVALWKIEKNKDVMPILINELESDTYDMSYVVQAVGMIGKPASEAIPVIEKHLVHQDKFVRQAAKSTLQILTAK